MKFIEASWPAPKNIKAYTTLKSGWGERHPYQDTYVGFYTSNPEESTKLQTLLQLPTEPIWVKQTHSMIALEATPDNKEKEADATFSNQPEQVCAILTADCLPVLICNTKGTQVAAIHAGWRGLAGGIIESTVNQLKQPATELMAWLGPAIGPTKFEVGQDVYNAFTLKHPEAVRAFKPHTDGKWLANLYELAKIRLNLLGISQIYGGDYCTYTQDDLFFSYRRDQGKTGRMVSLIWIEK